jgi:RNA polymerase sigma-70 factor (ECF subfamily)
MKPETVPRLGDGDPLPPEDRLSRGSVLALEQLYATQRPKLLRFFARRAARQDSDDLVQDSFIRLAIVARDPEKRIEHPEAYLGQIAANVLRNRAQSALQRSLSKQVPIDDLSLAGPDLVAALEARDLLNRLQSVLVKLPPKTREIFLSHRVDGLSYKALAERERLSVKGIEWHMRKAIAHLDRAIRSR